eukprot:10511981-Alexandrium_andersonii.AAC.1
MTARWPGTPLSRLASSGSRANSCGLPGGPGLPPPTPSCVPTASAGARTWRVVCRRRPILGGPYSAL